MFLIAPKSKNEDATASKPFAKIIGPTRVRSACDRCRMKKVKCNGETPCRRCMQDELVCTTARKAPSDPKAASIEYIRAMESQQAQLIRALKDIGRHVRQPVTEVDLREISDTVRKCGFDIDIEGRMDVSDPGELSNQPSQFQTPRNDHNHEIKDMNFTGKRKKEHDPSWEDGVTSIASDNRGSSSFTSPQLKDTSSLSSTSKRQKVPELFDDYWNLDAYQDDVAALSQNISASSQSMSTLPSDLDAVPNSQDQSHIPDWMLDGLLYPKPAIEPNEQTTNDSLPPKWKSGMGVESSTDTNPSEWDSTLWWDPFPLLDTNLFLAPDPTWQQ